jgi:hypothetical protein
MVVKAEAKRVGPHRGRKDRRIYIAAFDWTRAVGVCTRLAAYLFGDNRSLKKTGDSCVRETSVGKVALEALSAIQNS